MNKADIIAKLAPKLYITQDEARVILNSVLEVFTEALVEEKSLKLVDFGTFSVQKRAERIGRNPKTGTSLIFPKEKLLLLNKERL